MLTDLRAAPDLTDAEVLDRATAIAECILGDGFRMLPVLRSIDGAPDDLDRALNRSAFDPPSRARVKAFVRDHGTVHAGMARLAEAGLVGGALGAPVELTVAQLTHVTDTGEPEEGCDRWLAGDLPDGVAWPAHPAIHLVLELVGAPARSTSDIAGLLIDSWVETLPFQPDPKAVAPEAVDTPLRDARATTGLAVQARQASARAPQVILSAVSADGARWTTDSVVRVVESAIALSKARLVTYEKVPGDAAILPAIYAASPWLQGRKGLRFADVATIEWSRVAYPFLSEVE
jgi:hypothetical protein